MFSRHASSVTIVAALVAICTHSVQAQTHPYLNDANKSTPPTVGPSIDHHLFPRVMVHETHRSISNAAYSKYHVMTGTGYDLSQVANIQAQWPETMFLRHISGRAYASYTANFCQISQGVAFEATGPRSQGGPSSAGCAIYAGHWLYKAGTTLTQSINASTTTLRVANAAKVAAGQYVVIYDAPAGSFNNAEHALVTSRNLSNNTLTLQRRGFKSTGKSHAAGSIVAQHVLGQGPSNQLWAYNMSSKSPKDASGRTFGQFYADWLQQNYDRRATGQRPNANVAGILFDADFYFDLGSKGADANNDLVTDHGVSNSGVNWLGEGLDAFYTRLRNNLPNKIILGGVHDSRGYATLQGTQMENFPDFGNGDFNPNPRYRQLPSQIITYLFNMGNRALGAPNSHNLTKTPTKTYPGNASPRPTSNRHMRFTIGLTALDDGYVGTHSSHVADAWWDEYSVDVTPGSANFGKAINKSDSAGARRHRGWLGRPMDGFKRIYNSGAFAPGQSLLSGGTFENNLGGWSGTRVNLSRDTSTSRDGGASLRASKHTTYAKDFSGATIRSPQVNLVKDREYTLVFSAKASAHRDIRVAAGTENEKLPVDTKWRRYVMTWKQDSNQNKVVTFSVGKENTVFWLDTVYLFQGSADVFRRDFENGIVLVNASQSSKTINLGGQFHRIDGTQDSVNNGATVSSATLGARDALFLVRRDGEQQDAGSGSGGGPGTASLGDFVWNDADGDGIQDAGESGRAGVTVRLRTCDAGVIATTVTDGNGNYLFDELVAGAYQVEFVAPAGTVFSPAGQTTGGMDSNPDASGLTACIALAEGQDKAGADAGLIEQGGGGGGASLGDFVWNDNNADGIQNPGEPGRAGVTVSLRQCNGSTVATTQTDSNGLYQFSNLAAGLYQVQFVAPSGTTFSPANQTTNGMDSNPDPSGLSSCISLAAGQHKTGADAGLIDQGGSGATTCKRPNNYAPANVDGLFVWQNCSNDGWFVYVAAGGNTGGETFSGNVQTDPAMSGIGEQELESRDTFTRSGDRKRIDFDLIVYGNGQDGFVFSLPPSATKACLTLNQGGPIYVGETAAVFTSPVNLLNPGAACP